MADLHSAMRIRARSAIATFKGSPPLLIGTVILALFALVAIAAPFLTPYGPNEVNPAQAFQAPSFLHWSGTDELGRDILMRSLYGARISLSICFLATLFASALGILLGLVSGYRRKGTDAVIMRVMDVQLAFPAILLAMLVIVVMGRGFFSTVIAISIASVPAFARITRASTMSLAKQEYVTSARSMGAGPLYTMFITILPNAIGPILVQMVITGSVAILLEAGLSFLGLGIQPPEPSWGDMLRSGKGFLANAPYYAILPGLLLSLTVLSLELIGRGLQATISGSRAGGTS